MYEQPPRRTPFCSADRTLHSAGSDPDPIKFLGKSNSNNSAEHHEQAPSSLPPSFVERGEVLSGEEMTTRYTDEEWEKIFGEVEEEVGWEGGGRKRWEGGLGDVVGTTDHTLLKLDATESQIEELCEEARREGFASVCVRPPWVSRTTTSLTGTPIKTAAVIAFHEGTQSLSESILEVRSSLSSGASELDIVLNHQLLASTTPNKYGTIFNHLASLRQNAPSPTVLKLILETSRLSHFQIVSACTLAAAAGFDFVKTSTGFDGPGATVENVSLMTQCCEALAPRFTNSVPMKVKASGGIRSLDDAIKMLEAGTSRLGTSGGVEIAKEARERTEGKGKEEAGLETKVGTDH